MTITRDDDVLGGEPRIQGTRIGVRHIAERVIESDRSPAYVADQFDLPLAAVYAALAYYYEHIDEMRSLDRTNGAAFDRVREESLKPKEPIQ